MKHKNLKNLFFIYFNNIPSPYVVNRLNNLNQKNGIDVEGCFLSKKDNNQAFKNSIKKEFKFRYQFLKKNKIIQVKNKPDILITLYSNFTFILNILYFKIFGTKVLLHVVKTFDTWQKRSIFKEIVKFFIFNIVDGFHIPGSDAKKYIKKYLIFNKFFIFCPWNNSINKKKFKRKFKKKINLLYVGRISYYKGIHILIEAIKLLKSSNNFILNIIGPVDKKFNILKTIKNNKLDKKIKIIKKQSKNMLHSYYKNSDIFIFPTLGDPYGLVIDEALSYGLPIISSKNVGELKKRVKNNFNGLTYNCFNAEQLAQKIKYLINNKKALHKFSLNSYSLSKNFDHDKYYNKIIMVKNL